MAGDHAPSGSAESRGAERVGEFLTALVAHDWDAVAGLVTDGVRRTGPFGDVYEGRSVYIDFLKGVMSSLQGYRMDIDRILATRDGTAAVAELSETVVMDGRTIVTPQSLVFDLDATSRIDRVSIYMRTLPPGAG